MKLKQKHGKNAVLKGMNLVEGATGKDRNNTIGGHKAWVKYIINKKNSMANDQRAVDIIKIYAIILNGDYCERQRNYSKKLN